jgi:hypothetical protein
VIHSSDNYFACNYAAFLLLAAREFDLQYQQVYQMFSNIYYAALEDSELYNKWGWFFDFQNPGVTTAEYKRMIVGDPNDFLGITRSFMHNCTLKGLTEFIRSFTGRYALVDTYRDFIGWIGRDKNKAQIWNHAVYWGDLPYTDVDTPSYGNLPLNQRSNKRIILMDKRFKLNTIKLTFFYWPFDNATKLILEELIYKIIPINLKVEIIWP